jgi:hypothetical protein
MFGCFSEAEYSAYLSRLERADERTRTADLLITSELFLLDDTLLHST